MRTALGIWLLVSILTAVSRWAVAEDVFRYTGSVATSDGRTREVSFKGGVAAGRLVGTVRVDGVTFLVSGPIGAGGVIAGTVRLNDSVPVAKRPVLGTFHANPSADGQTLSVGYDVAGATGLLTSVPGLASLAVSTADEGTVSSSP